MTNFDLHSTEQYKYDIELVAEEIIEDETPFSDLPQKIAICKYIKALVENLMDISTDLKNKNLSHLLSLAAQEAYLEERTGEIRMTHI
jgi:hypothetical protein